MRLFPYGTIHKIPTRSVEVQVGIAEAQELEMGKSKVMERKREVVGGKQ